MRHPRCPADDDDRRHSRIGYRDDQLQRQRPLQVVQHHLRVLLEEAAPGRHHRPGGRHAQAAHAAPEQDAHAYVGAAGEAEFAPDFALQVEAWAKASAEAGAKHISIGDSDTDRERLKSALEAEPKSGPGELWLVLIGHGTFDGREAKLNLQDGMHPSAEGVRVVVRRMLPTVEKFLRTLQGGKE